MGLTLDLARRLIAAAEDEAGRQGLDLSFAVVDAGYEFMVGDVLIRLVARVADEFSFLAKARTEIGIKIASLFLSGRFVGDKQCPIHISGHKAQIRALADGGIGAKP